MISKFVLEERVREWGLREDVVEKDYVLGWVLWGIGVHPKLSVSWAFKGGTCLKKCYIETYRFSEDLDFTVLPDGPVRQGELEPIIREVLAKVAEESGVNFSGRPFVLKTHPSGLYTEGRIYYQGPRNAPQVASIRLDLSASEKVVRPTVRRPIAHAYPDDLPAPATVRCYSFDELFAEKIRAMGERSRPRDLYDIINLFRRADLQAEPRLIRAILVEKCQAKGIPVPTFAVIEASPVRVELESEWANMLVHQLPVLPPFDSFWAELPALFNWLESTGAAPQLQTVPAGAGEEPAGVWSPPPTIYAWGKGIPLETMRFAAANHLCINLGYGGSKRLVEPYSLRRTQDGNLILHAIKVVTREPRAYRIDRVQSIEVTTRPFAPAYKIEFSSSGPIHAAPTTTNPRSAPRRHAGRPARTGIIYVIQCSWCQKTFRRTKMSMVLKPHKDKNGYPCHGRAGFLVGTHYG
ncbi:MAG: nucleotidyl transferase AbiEii/AbiGii toxin family protein [Phycisphaerae bacterium]